MLSKEIKHQKSEEFRQRIALPTQRAAAIRDLLAKTNYDESDHLRLTILLQKIDYIHGCEQEYCALISKVLGTEDGKLKSKALDFYRRWHG